MTEAVKHTPAPWQVVDGDIYDTRLDGKAGRALFRNAGSIVRSWERVMVDGEGQANASLIAAAPELIDVVREMIPFLEEIARQRHPAWRPEMADRDSVLGRAYSAIAKAEGRS